MQVGKARPLRNACAFSHLYPPPLHSVSTTTPIGEFMEPLPRSYRITIQRAEYEFTRISAPGSSVNRGNGAAPYMRKSLFIEDDPRSVARHRPFAACIWDKCP